MNGVLRKTKMKDWYEFYRQTCPICHKSGGCIIHEEGDRVACIRVQSETQFGKSALPSWIHWLKNGVKVDKIVTVDTSNRSKLPDYILDQIYTSLLSHQESSLTNLHLDHLLKERKMSTTTIRTRGYGSFPKKPWIVAKDILPEQLIKRMEDNSFNMGLPGFFKNEYGWSISGNEGILIPYRNEYNQITGFQIRVDHIKNDVEIDATNYEGLFAVVREQPNSVHVLVDGEIIQERRLELNETIEIKSEDGRVGTVKLKKGQRYFWLSSANKEYGTGAGDPIPIHIAMPTQQLQMWNDSILKKKQDTNQAYKTESVWLTEGALKADIAVDHIARAFQDEIKEIGSTMIAVPGINSWRSVLPTLENMQVKRINLAFDMDAVQNPFVKHFFLDLVRELKQRGYIVYVALWNPINKGIDDALLNNVKVQLREL